MKYLVVIAFGVSGIALELNQLWYPSALFFMFGFVVVTVALIRWFCGGTVMAAVLPPDTIITCESGHYVCTTNHELIVSSERPMVRSSWFDRFDKCHVVPQPGDSVCVCVCGICGAPWLDERPGVRPDGTVTERAAKIHTADGWWP